MSDQKIKVLVLYWSHGGNTKDVADSIYTELRKNAQVDPHILEIRSELEVDYDDYQLIFIGSPVYSFLPPPEVMKFLRHQHDRSKTKASAPEKPGRGVVVFCTYGGGHTGVNEAVPALKYVGQFFEHKGIRVVGEWPVVGDFPDVQDPAYRTSGRLGDITGRPDESDLKNIRGRVAGLLVQLHAVLAG